MYQPWTSVVVGDGNIVVVEFGNHRVQILRCVPVVVFPHAVLRAQLLRLTFSGRYQDGVHQRTFGHRGTGPGEFINPTGALSLSSLSHLPRVFFKHLSGIALDGERGNIIVFDSGNSRLQVLRYHTGMYVSSHGCRGSLPGQFRGIGSISWDRQNSHLFVADGDNHRVQVLRYKDFACVRVIGSYGTGPCQFIRPYGASLFSVLACCSHFTALSPQDSRLTTVFTWLSSSTDRIEFTFCDTLMVRMCG